VGDVNECVCVCVCVRLCVLNVYYDGYDGVGGDDGVMATMVLIIGGDHGGDDDGFGWCSRLCSLYSGPLVIFLSEMSAVFQTTTLVLVSV